MFNGREDIRKRLFEIVEKFRNKGAISPDKAMSAQELDLPPKFGEAMKRRLGRSGIIIEVNGKYYLSEERLKEIQSRQQQGRTFPHSPNRMMTLRMLRIGTMLLVVILFLMNIFIQSWEIRVLSASILVVWIIITLFQIYQLSKIHNRMSR